MADRWTTVNRTARADGSLPDEDASFDQLYSLQRIELRKKLGKSWEGRKLAVFDTP
jgi:hypothetical protein